MQEGKWWEAKCPSLLGHPVLACPGTRYWSAGWVFFSGVRISHHVAIYWLCSSPLYQHACDAEERRSNQGFPLLVCLSGKNDSDLPMTYYLSDRDTITVRAW